MFKFLNTYNPNPVAFTVFGIDVMWYGILVALGMALATVYACRRAPAHGFSGDRMLDLVLICVPVGVLGARLYYVIFSWDYYKENLNQILNFRGGGLAIHGGLIVGIGLCLILCKVWKMKPLPVLDAVIPGIALGQAIGRWGNYFNSEAHGGPTNLPWAIPVNGEMVHPTFLYESLWCFFLFILLWRLDQKPGFPGRLICLYMMLYSLERFFVEALRTDSLMIGPLRQAQLISIVMFAAGLIGYVILRGRYKAKA